MRFSQVLGMLFVFSGCSARECVPDASAVRARGEADSRALSASVARVIRADSLDVLVLSGGGSHGAFGAGLLRGWRKAPTARPTFAVVTGVSTGALLATHAFLGRPEDDNVLERLYTTVTDGDIFRKRFFLTLPFSDSIATSAPLQRLIEREIPDTLIDQVAKAGIGRRLFVATTNMDEGRLRIWDMTALAEQRDYAKYRQVLLASSSVPGLYPPVEIAGALHCDGGVREQLFIRKIMIDLSRARPARGWKITVHVVLNGKLDVEPACVDTRLLPVALRGVEVLAAASAVGNLYQSKAVADLSGAAWRLARIPAYVSVLFGSQTFDPEGMRELYEDGVQFGVEGAWETTVPELEDATRVMEINP